MEKKDILELKKRLKKNDCTFTRLSGCYVDINKNKILSFSKTFLNIEEDELYKYIEIAKKTLSSNIGNNILNLEFKNTEKQNFLINLNKSKLKDDNILNEFYDIVIQNYISDKNYLILLFSDAYDIITKTTDNIKIDNSEYVFEYIICSICPVETTKSALGYLENENRIGSRIRDKIVSMPDIGFIFPSFCNRNTDVNSVMYYTKNDRDIKNEFIENAIGCKTAITISNQKEIFKNIISAGLGKNEQETEDIMIEIQENINTIIDEKTNIYNDSVVMLDNNVLSEALSDINISKESIEKINKIYNDEFKDNIPVASNIIDKKFIALGEQKRNENILKSQIVKLSKQIENIKLQEKENDIILKTINEKNIKSEIIDGTKYILIPVNNNETININGKIRKL